ncbi:N-acetyl-gamma-glutamyl-phosphate reductase [Anaerolineales bacterium]
MDQKIRVGVFGASGYAGLDLIEILARHPQVEVMYATSNTFAGEAVQHLEMRYLEHERAGFENVEVVFLALPHTASAIVAKRALDAGVKVIDLSADFRLDSAEAYEKWYGHEHPCPELLADAPYGLVEVNREQLKGVDLIAVPGCYPTTSLLGLYPLAKDDLIAAGQPIVIDAKSGVSGAGRSPKLNSLFVEVYGNFSPYNAGRSHRHLGEMEQELKKWQADAGEIVFTPHLLPVDRGLMTSIYVHLNQGLAAADVQALYEETYAGEALVKVLPAGRYASLNDVVRTNRCVMSVNPVYDQFIHITSVTDNLRKGASGQAVQNFNLMYGLEETTALL